MPDTTNTDPIKDLAETLFKGIQDLYPNDNRKQLEAIVKVGDAVALQRLVMATAFEKDRRAERDRKRLQPPDPNRPAAQTIAAVKR